MYKFSNAFLEKVISWLAGMMMEELTIRTVCRGSAIHDATSYDKPGLITYLIHNR
jgi:hypothetical protein